MQEALEAVAAAIAAIADDGDPTPEQVQAALAAADTLDGQIDALFNRAVAEGDDATVAVILAVDRARLAGVADAGVFLSGIATAAKLAGLTERQFLNVGAEQFRAAGDFGIDLFARGVAALQAADDAGLWPWQDSGEDKPVA